MRMTSPSQKPAGSSDRVPAKTAAAQSTPNDDYLKLIQEVESCSTPPSNLTSRRWQLSRNSWKNVSRGWNEKCKRSRPASNPATQSKTILEQLKLSQSADSRKLPNGLVLCVPLMRTVFFFVPYCTENQTSDVDYGRHRMDPSGSSVDTTMEDGFRRIESMISAQLIIWRQKI